MAPTIRPASNSVLRAQKTTDSEVRSPHARQSRTPMHDLTAPSGACTTCLKCLASARGKDGVR